MPSTLRHNHTRYSIEPNIIMESIMHWSIKFAGIFVLGMSLLLTGCPDKSSPSSSGNQKPETGETVQKQAAKPAAESLPQPEAVPADVTAATTLLEQNQGTYEKNAAGAIVAINLNISNVPDQASQDELFDAINKLVDLEKVTFSGPGIGDSSILRLSSLKKVKTAHFKNTNITTESLKTMAGTMKDLTDLSVNRCLALDKDSLTVIGKEMPKLKILDLQSNAFRTFDLKALTELPALEQLDLRVCMNVEGGVLKDLANITTLKVLRLKGGDTSFRDRDIAHLVGHPSLKAFFLQDATSVSDDFIDSLMKIPTLVDLSMFRLSDISNDGLMKLEGSKLQRLFIRENSYIDDEGIAVVKTMPDLSRLILYEVRAITDEGLTAAITDNKKLINLALYDMESITDKSIEALKTTTSLRSLELRKTGQTDETLKMVSLLPRLETLTIGFNSKFTDAGLAYLGDSKSLKTIEITRDSTGISDEAIKEFQAKYPKIEIVIRTTGERE